MIIYSQESHQAFLVKAAASLRASGRGGDSVLYQRDRELSKIGNAMTQTAREFIEKLPKLVKGRMAAASSIQVPPVRPRNAGRLVPRGHAPVEGIVAPPELMAGPLARRGNAGRLVPRRHAVAASREVQMAGPQVASAPVPQAALKPEAQAAINPAVAAPSPAPAAPNPDAAQAGPRTLLGNATNWLGNRTNAELLGMGALGLGGVGLAGLGAMGTVGAAGLAGTGMGIGIGAATS